MAWLVPPTRQGACSVRNPLHTCMHLQVDTSYEPVVADYGTELAFRREMRNALADGLYALDNAVMGINGTACQGCVTVRHCSRVHASGRGCGPDPAVLGPAWPTTP